MTDQQRIKMATRNLFFFTGGEFIGTIGAHVYMFGISFFVLTLTGSATSFAMTLLFSMVPRIILSPIAGHIADRFPRKKILLFCHGIMTLIMLCVFFYTLSFGLSLPVIYITSALIATFSTFAGISLTAGIANFIDGDRIQRAISLTQSSTSLASILGPVLGGVMYGFFTIEVFLFTQVIAYSVTLFCEANIDFSLYKGKDNDVTPDPEKKETMWESLKAGAVYVKQDKILFPIMMVALWLNFFFMASIVGLPFIIIEVLGASSRQLGMIEGMIGVGTLIFSLIVATRKQSTRPIRQIRIGMILSGLIFAGIALPLLFSFGSTGFVVFYMCLNFLMGGIMIVINTPLMVLLQKTTPENYRGRVFGLLEMVASGISPLGLVLFGFLYDVISPQWIILTCAALLISVTLISMHPSRVSDGDVPVDEKSEVKQPKLAQA
ncbi:MFS transporter [Jeotgalibacillus sp. R-1-5s-1]|uniref:MFS transporter n=1 Tax=Jeotgalibacillus sp. R-1-5s-1 TaxID=2555897 RepID=UPI00106C6B3A|nr:MFS transporter [Jeotgalibacillus sp. R-1-5s-1]TFE00009.1 MFS transporter [Jeotgalibacillus sp. R-1-5s-1]